MRSAGRTVSRDELAAVLYQRRSTPYERSLDVHISHLRKKLEGAGRSPIRTIRGVGLPVRGGARGRSVRSVYAKILMWSFATLVLSLGAFVGVTFFMSMHARGDGMDRVDAMLLEDAAAAYQSGGAPQLAAYMDRLNRRLIWRRYFTDSEGKDLATGEDRSAFFNDVARQWGVPHHSGGRWIVVQSSRDGRYRLIIVNDAAFDLTSYIPFYLLILAAVALVCWMLALNIASPLRSLARTVDRFGAGDLSVRVNSTRKDEIGELSRAFDRMAERIGTLLTAERRLLQDISHELRSTPRIGNPRLVVGPPKSSRKKTVSMSRTRSARLAAVTGSSSWVSITLP